MFAPCRGSHPCTERRWQVPLALSLWALMLVAGGPLLSGRAAAQVGQAPDQPPAVAPGEFDIRGSIPEALSPPNPGTGTANTTVVPRRTAPRPGGDGGAGSLVRLEVTLTDEGEPLDEGLVWRIYQAQPGRDGRPHLVTARKTAAPAVRLKPGDYYVHVSYGQANVTRRISVGDEPEKSERLVLSAGGLRVSATVTSATPVPEDAVVYDILSDERDQLDNRTRIVTGAKPGTIIRLNSGLYRIQSRYGKANASVEASVTVEPGKLTDVSVTHEGARVSFRLVMRAGGEALASTQWSVHRADGSEVVRSVGALPSHILAPGIYTVVAQADGRTFQQEFKVQNGRDVSLELVFR